MNGIFTALFKSKSKPKTPWEFQYCKGMPDRPSVTKNEILRFDFPSGKNSVHYLNMPRTSPIKNSITMTYAIEASPDAVFDFADKKGTRPAMVTLWVQRKGDDMTAKGKYSQYRWWGISSITDLSVGTFHISIDMDRAKWTSVFGPGDDAGFAGAMNNPQRVGMTFGGGGGLGHGVRMAKGKATFRLLDFKVS
jgi:hypothetical protein